MTMLTPSTRLRGEGRGGGNSKHKKPPPQPSPTPLFCVPQNKEAGEGVNWFPPSRHPPLERERELIFCGDCEGDCFDDAGAGGGVFRGADGGYYGVRAGFCCAEYQRVARQ